MELTIEPFSRADLVALAEIWNEVVEDGMAFPQNEPLTDETAWEFFSRQDFVGVAKLDSAPVGLYILHRNNVGRCGHHANASYAVRSGLRGKHIGEALVKHSLAKAKELGYRLLVFNAIVDGNLPAICLYEKLGFHRVGRVPGGFLLKTGVYQDTFIYYHTL